MESEKVKEFIKYVKTDPKAKEKLGNFIKPEDPEKVIAWYAEAAKLLGSDVTEADLRVFLEDETADHAARTENSAAEVSKLTDADLDAVSGGGRGRGATSEECKYSFEDYENCWRKDGCDNNWVTYDNYICNVNSQGVVCGATQQLKCQEFIL